MGCRKRCVLGSLLVDHRNVDNCSRRGHGVGRGVAEAETRALGRATCEAAEIVPRSVGAAESPLSIAARGGKHAGFLKQAESFAFTVEPDCQQFPAANRAARG